MTVTINGSGSITEEITIDGVKVGQGGGNVATNTAVGAGALAANTTGTNSVAVGYNALDANTTGNINTAVGALALTANTTGSSNTAMGFAALEANTTASNNTGIGYAALGLNTTGASNTAVGYGALDANTTGSTNAAFGRDALGANTTANDNAAFGAYAAAKSTASGITAIGYGALFENTTGANNTALGNSALANNTTGTVNTAVGYQALDACTTGTNNTVIGDAAGGGITTGTNNTCLGERAGNFSTILTTGGTNTLIGSACYTSASNASDQIVIGYAVAGQGNSNVTIGSGNSGKIYNAYSVNATWTQTSDERLKKNIQDDTLGLSFVNRLRPVKYQWKPSNEIDPSLPYYNEVNQRNTEAVMHGLVAQEVKAALDAEGVTTFAGWDQGPDTIQAISREMFISPLIKAVQELSAQVTALQEEVNALKGQ